MRGGVGGGWVGGGLIVALILLTGHTQSAFISLAGLAFYALLPGADTRVPWWRRALVVAGAAALGGLLAAAQLLPTAELGRFSLRAAGLPFNERVSFSLPPAYLARALLPGYSRPVPPGSIEYVAAVGVGGLLLIACRLSLADGRRRLTRIAALAGLGLFLALGYYNPLYLLLACFAPGFMHFRVPARWLALWAFAAALLIGAAVEQVGRGELRLTGRRWALVGGLLAGLLTWGALGGRVEPGTLVAWLAAALLAAGLVWLSARPRPWTFRLLTVPQAAALGLTALVVAELVLSARTLPRSRATAPQAYTSLRPAAAHLLASGEDSLPPARFLSLSALVFDPGDLPEMRVIYGPQLAPDPLYDLIISAKHREVLSPDLPLVWQIPAVDGYDGGLLPLARYLALQRAFLPAEAIALDGRLRENLTTVPDGRWLDLCNVRYVITDKVFDAWLDDVFYDLQFGARLAAGEEAEVASVPAFEATALGLVSYLDGAAALADGTVVGEAVVSFAGGVTRTLPLRAGVETAEGVYGSGVAHAQAPVGGHFWPGRPEGNDYAVRLRWGEAATPVAVTVRALLPEGRLVVRGVSLVDERTGSFQSLVISDRGRFRLAHSGDVKVYENLDVLPRAWIAPAVWLADGEDAALARMQRADFDPLAEVVIESRDGAAGGSAGGTARILSYTPERVEIEADLVAPGYLVLTDANYPGWVAQVDGEEVEIFPADLLFRAVRLGAGRQRVVFTFRPRWLGIGSGISLAALVIVLAASLLCSAHRRP